jgi:ANTAR domain
MVRTRAREHDATRRPVIPTNIRLTGRFDSELDTQSGFDQQAWRTPIEHPIGERHPRPNIRRYCRNYIRRCCKIAENRAVIDQAKGMLIFLYGMDDQTAIDTLRRHPRTRTSNCEPWPNSWCLTTAHSATEKHSRPAWCTTRRYDRPRADHSGLELISLRARALRTQRRPRLS